MFAFIRGDKLHIGWLGDSQALLVRQGNPLQLVDPHKPEREVGVFSVWTTAVLL